MRRKIIALITGICLLPTTNILAATSEVNLEQAIQKLMVQTEALQREVVSLRSELNQVKREKQHLAGKQVNTTESVSAPITVTYAPTPGAPVRQVSDTGTLEAEQEKSEFINFLIGSPVLTSPMLSIRSQFDAADLIVNYPGINEDLFFLQQRKELANAIGYENLPSQKRPQLLLSGTIEALGTYQSVSGVSPSTNSLELSQVELDVYAEVGPWAHGFLSILYDTSTLDPTLTGSGNSSNNNKLFVDRGFVTIGNLNKSPVYFSAGRMYVPFGRYSSNMYSNPVTKSLGRTNVDAVLLGYAKGDAYLSAYAYDGGTNVGQSGIGGWGTNFGYDYTSRDVEGKIGFGFLNNLADSQNAQSPAGGGFSTNPAAEMMQHEVPAMNIHASASKGPFSIRGEFVNAMRKYATADLTFNGVGAQPRAIHVESAYAFEIQDRPSNFSLAYGQTWESLGLGLPKNSYTATFNTSIWKNTVQTIEYRHDTNYASTDTSTRLCETTIPACPGTPIPGSIENTIFARIAVFF